MSCKLFNLYEDNGVNKMVFSISDSNLKYVIIDIQIDAKSSEYIYNYPGPPEKKTYKGSTAK